MRHVPRGPADDHSDALARAQRAGGPEPPVALDPIDRVVLPGGAERSGVGDGPHRVADARRHGHEHLGRVDRRVPLVPGGVPVDLVVIVVGEDPTPHVVDDGDELLGVDGAGHPGLDHDVAARVRHLGA